MERFKILLKAYERFIPFIFMGLYQFSLPDSEKSATMSYICKCEFNVVLSQELQDVINIINCPSFLKFSFISALGNRFESLSFKDKFVLMPIKGLILYNLSGATMDD